MIQDESLDSRRICTKILKKTGSQERDQQKQGKRCKLWHGRRKHLLPSRQVLKNVHGAQRGHTHEWTIRHGAIRTHIHAKMRKAKDRDEKKGRTCNDQTMCCESPRCKHVHIVSIPPHLLFHKKSLCGGIPDDFTMKTIIYR